MLLTNLELIDFISLTMRDPARKKELGKYVRKTQVWARKQKESKRKERNLTSANYAAPFCHRREFF